MHFRLKTYELKFINSKEKKTRKKIKFKLITFHQNTNLITIKKITLIQCPNFYFCPIEFVTSNEWC